MSSSTLLRWSGLAALVFGVLHALIAVIHFVFFPTELARSSVMALSTWQILQAVDLALKILFLWALVGLYSRQAKETGVLGFAGFLTLFAGFMLSFGTQWGFFMLGADLTRAAPAVLDSDIPSGVLGVVAELIPYALAFLGLVLFALATLLAKVFPRWVSGFSSAPASAFLLEMWCSARASPRWGTRSGRRNESWRGNAR